MPKKPILPIAYDWSHAISAAELAGMTPLLNAARQQVLEESPDLLSGPQQLLADYKRDMRGSVLARLMAASIHLRDRVDRVVVLAAADMQRGLRALLEACCEPNFNELSQSDRGTRPRLYFVDERIDNDAWQGLLHVLGGNRVARVTAERWGIVAMETCPDRAEIALPFREFLARLEQSCGDRPGLAATLAVVVAPHERALVRSAQERGCSAIFTIVPGSAPASVFSLPYLLPAALASLDLVRLLEAVVHMNERFSTTIPGNNPVLDFAATAVKHASDGNLRAGNQSLDCLAFWHEQRVDSPSQGSASLTTDIVVQHPRNDLWATQEGAALAELAASSRSANEQQRRTAGDFTAEIILPRADEAAIGQLMQMLQLAGAVQRQL